jgi:phosphoribosylamine-glycine ligase
MELSAFLITDGEAFKMLPAAKDYKRIGVGDTGPNTGGMGAVSSSAVRRQGLHAEGARPCRSTYDPGPEEGRHRLQRASSSWA